MLYENLDRRDLWAAVSEPLAIVNSNSSSGVSSTSFHHAPSIVRDINSLFGGGLDIRSSATLVNHQIFFSASITEHGAELWVKDSPLDEARLVSDIVVGAGSSSPMELTNVDGTLYFSAFTADAGRELWKSDGTAAGTVRVSDIQPGSLGSNPTSMTSFNGALYFNATHTQSGSELWKSDGTSAGTTLVKDIALTRPISETYTYYHYIEYPEGNWYSDFQEQRTRTWDSIDSSAPTSLFNHQGVLYFSAWTFQEGRELWKTDGSTAGTQLAADLFHATYSDTYPYARLANDSSPSDFLSFNGLLYFAATSGNTGRELWRTDGTSIGTRLVKDIAVTRRILVGDTGYPYFEPLYNEYIDSSNPSSLVAFDGSIYFAAWTREHGRELWRSDGTIGSGVRVSDIQPGAESSSPSHLIVFQSNLYFSATTPEFGNELWASDGTGPNTRLIKDLDPGSSSSLPRHIQNLSGTLHFIAQDETNTAKFWTSSGSASNTQLAPDSTAVNQNSTPLDSRTSMERYIFPLSIRSGDSSCGKQLARRAPPL